MKKILLVTRPIAPPWDEASKNFAYFLAKNIPDLEIHLMTKGVLPELGKNIIQHPIYTASENDMNFSQKIKSLFFQWQNKNSFDVAHYFFTPTNLNSFLIKNFLSSKKTKSIQTVATLREDLYSDDEIKKLMFGDLIITYSDYAKTKLNSLGFENVKRVYPGIDLVKYCHSRENGNPVMGHEVSTLDSRLRGNDTNKTTPFAINFTGEYTRLGAIDIVVNSFIEVSKKIPEARLDLAVRVKNEKDAVKKKEVVEKLKNNNLLEKVSFFDDGKFQMEEIYNRCDISLFPVANMYGKFDIPLAVVEAMACEKPVILSNLPILAELGNKENAVIIKTGDTEALTEAILDLYNNPEKRKTIGRAARKFVEERFDIKKVAETYEEIYKTL